MASCVIVILQKKQFLVFDWHLWDRHQSSGNPLPDHLAHGPAQGHVRKNIWYHSMTISNHELAVKAWTWYKKIIKRMKHVYLLWFWFLLRTCTQQKPSKTYIQPMCRVYSIRFLPVFHIQASKRPRTWTFDEPMMGWWMSPCRALIADV